MAKKGEARGIIYLACSECKERNYTTTKNRKMLTTTNSRMPPKRQDAHMQVTAAKKPCKN
jgi:ribosomal protein L33